MRPECSLEALNKRFERLVAHRVESESFSLSEAERQLIADKFAKKSLQELNEMANQLDKLTTD